MTTTAGRRLTTAHRLAQARIGAETVTAVRKVWPLLDPTDDRTFDRWIEAAAAVIDSKRSVSARLSGAYVEAFKLAETSRPAVTVLAGPAAPEGVATSLLVTGPISVRSALGRGVTLARAISVAEASSSAAALRHALNGGRDTILGSLANDPDAQGWARVTSGKTCKFCSMLAGRGAVYSASTADFQAHDGCSCTAEPVYR